MDAAKDGVLPLPVIKNGKTVDPQKDGKDGREKSPKVLQLETAMGSAIECFPGAGAILIPRTRFAPVKTTADMLALMSDAYEVTEDFRMVLRSEVTASTSGPLPLWDPRPSTFDLDSSIAVTSSLTAAAATVQPL